MNLVTQSVTNSTQHIALLLNAGNSVTSSVQTELTCLLSTAQTTCCAILDLHSAATLQGVRSYTVQTNKMHIS